MPLLLAFLLVLALTIRLPIAVGQSPSPLSALERARNDYNLQFTKYRDAQDEYTKTKAAYLSFKTAVSKNDAFVATKDFLIQIDQLYLVFITQVEEHGNALNWSKSNFPKDEISKALSEEKSYLADHKQKVQSTKTLEELPPLAQELKSHIENPFEPRLNKTLATFEVVETESVFEEFNSLSRILDRVVVFKLRAGETKSILANWASEIKDIRDKTTEKLNEAKNELASKEGNTIPESDLEEISDLTKNTKTELMRSKPLFEELVRIL